jgi:hypothetical protein
MSPGEVTDARGGAGIDRHGASISAELPPEIQQFLEQSYSQTLLVRGPSGAGKTTLALTTLHQFKGRKIFISARADHVRLASLFPWIMKDGHDIEILEIGPIFEYPVWARTALARLRASWASKSSTAHEPADDYVWLPPTFRDTWRSLENSGPALVVIDSWDGLIDTYLEAPAGLLAGELPDRAEIERALARLLLRPNVHFIFVVEREGEAPLDYLVDGIVSLSVPRIDGRPERWLQILKMRGVRLDETDYPFTLQGGGFETLRSFPVTVTTVPAHAEIDPDPATGSIWPGSNAFATAFGRLPVGQLSLVEIEPGVPTEGVRLVLMPMVDAVLAQGGKILLSMPPTMNVR